MFQMHYFLANKKSAFVLSLFIVIILHSQYEAAHSQVFQRSEANATLHIINLSTPAPGVISPELCFQIYLEKIKKIKERR